MATAGPSSVDFAIRGPIARGDLPGLCQRVCRLLSASDAEIVRCDVAGIDPDAVTVDALARLQLAARRQGCQVQLCHASDALLELVAFMGLEDVCGCDEQSDEFSSSVRSIPSNPNEEEEP